MSMIKDVVENSTESKTIGGFSEKELKKLKQSYRPNKEYTQSLKYRIDSLSKESILSCLANGFDVNESFYGGPVLFFSQDRETYDVMIYFGANPKLDQQSIMKYSVVNFKKFIIEMFWDSFSQVIINPGNYNTPIHQSTDPEVIKFVYKKGVDFAKIPANFYDKPYNYTFRAVENYIRWQNNNGNEKKIIDFLMKKNLLSYLDEIDFDLGKGKSIQIPRWYLYFFVTFKSTDLKYVNSSTLNSFFDVLKGTSFDLTNSLGQNIFFVIFAIDKEDQFKTVTKLIKLNASPMVKDKNGHSFYDTLLLEPKKYSRIIKYIEANVKTGGHSFVSSSPTVENPKSVTSSKPNQSKTKTAMKPLVEMTIQQQGEDSTTQKSNVLSPISTNLDGLVKYKKLGEKKIELFGSDLVKVLNNNKNIVYLFKNGDLFGFGSNLNGVLGDGTIQTSSNPKKIMSNVKDFIFAWDELYVLLFDGSLYKVGFNNVYRYIRYLYKRIFKVPAMEDDEIEDSLLKYNKIVNFYSTNFIQPKLTLFKALVSHFSPRLIMTNVKSISEDYDYYKITKEDNKVYILTNPEMITLNKYPNDNEEIRLFSQFDSRIVPLGTKISNAPDDDDDIDAGIELYLDEEEGSFEFNIVGSTVYVSSGDESDTVRLLDKVKSISSAFNPLLIFVDTNDILYVTTNPIGDRAFLNAFNKKKSFEYLKVNAIKLGKIVEGFGELNYSDDISFIVFLDDSKVLKRATFSIKHSYSQEIKNWLIGIDIIENDVIHFSASENKIIFQTTDKNFYIAAIDFGIPSVKTFDKLLTSNVPNLKDFSIIKTKTGH